MTPVNTHNSSIAGCCRPAEATSGNPVDSTDKYFQCMHTTRVAECRYDTSALHSEDVEFRYLVLVVGSGILVPGTVLVRHS